jgi:hypothetical protein
MQQQAQVEEMRQQAANDNEAIPEDGREAV